MLEPASDILSGAAGIWLELCNIGSCKANSRRNVEFP